MKKGLILDTDIPNIVTNYLQGASLVKISREYHVNKSRIKDILEMNNVPIRKRGEQVDKNKYSTTRKYCFNESYFEKIDTLDKAYWLGFLYADGCVYFPKTATGNTKGARVEITLKQEDEYMLHNFIYAIDGDMKTSNKIVNLDGKEFPCVRVFVNSIKMANDLVDKGCTPRKSLTLKFPEFLREDFISHFIRGYFDGDGCVHFYEDKQFKSFGLNIMGTRDFLVKMQEYLYNIGITSISIYDDIRTSAVSMHLFGIDNLNKFFNLIYKNKSYFLERKYDLFLSALKFYEKDYYMPEIPKMVGEMDWSD